MPPQRRPRLLPAEAGSTLPASVRTSLSKTRVDSAGETIRNLEAATARNLEEAIRVASSSPPKDLLNRLDEAIGTKAVPQQSGPLERGAGSMPDPSARTGAGVRQWRTVALNWNSLVLLKLGFRASGN